MPAVRAVIVSPSVPADQIVPLSRISRIRWTVASMRIRLTASGAPDCRDALVAAAAAGVSSGPKGVFDCVCCCTTVRPRGSSWGVIRDDSSGRPDPRGGVDRNRFIGAMCMQHRPSPPGPASEHRTWSGCRRTALPEQLFQRQNGELGGGAEDGRPVTAGVPSTGRF